MRITEPATLCTDYILGTVSTFFAYHLYRLIPVQPQPGLYYWILTFFLLSLAAYIGGTYHGFRVMLGEKKSQLMWKTTVYVAGLASLTFVLAAAFSTIRGTVLLTAIVLFALSKTIILFFALKKAQKFRCVVYDYTVSLVMVALLYGIFTPFAVARWIIAGIAVLGAASAIQVFKLSPHRHFNHNDLYHIIQIIALYLLWTGVRLWAML